MKGCITLNKQFTKLKHQMDGLFSIYQDNIQQKFMLLYHKTLIPNRKEFDKRFVRYEELVTGYKISFTDFKANTYLNNLDGIYEKYFPLWKIIDYRSKLELELVNKFDPEYNQQNKEPS